jgi:hypothetical protein
MFKFFKEHENMWEACALKTTIFPPIKVLPLSYGNIIFGVGEHKKSYLIIIEDYLIDNCMNFVTMMASSLRRAREAGVV